MPTSTPPLHRYSSSRSSNPDDVDAELGFTVRPDPTGPLWFRSTSSALDASNESIEPIRATVLSTPSMGPVPYPLRSHRRSYHTPAVSEAASEVPNYGQFDHDVFAAAVHGDGDLSRAWDELEKCRLDPPQVIRAYYGKIENESDARRKRKGNCVTRSPLFHLVHPNCASGTSFYTPPETRAARQHRFNDSRKQSRIKRLLDHPVMQTIVLVKWRVFGMRMYLEQLAMHCLLLLTVTLSVAMHLVHTNTVHLTRAVDDEKLQAFGATWLTLVLCLVVVRGATSCFQWRFRMRWVIAVLALVGICVLVLHYSAALLFPLLTWARLRAANAVLLGITAMYFYHFEIEELFGEVDDSTRRVSWYERGLWFVYERNRVIANKTLKLVVGKNKSAYFESYWNRMQLPTYGFLLIYAGMSLATDASEFIVYTGIPATLVVWLLSLQFLEVHGTAGYLLPIVRNMFSAVYGFLIFFAPIQCAYTCAYYLLFLASDEPSYSTVAKSFVTTYLVTLTQIETDPFEKLPSPVLKAMGYMLLLSHATVVVVMLLNVLIAMMNETMGSSLRKAQLEARVTFAGCVLRSEKTRRFRAHVHDPVLAADLEHVLLDEFDFVNDDFNA